MFQMVNPCVYWIRLPEHSDFMTEGYVGVTKRGVDVRFDQHLRLAKRFKRGIVYSNLRKYSDVIICDILVEGSESYCYEVEQLIRPRTRIGWNNQRGGMSPDKQFMDDYSRRSDWINKLRDFNLGKSHSIETKNKLSEISRLKHLDKECRRKLIDAASMRKTSVNPNPQFWKRSLGKLNFSDIVNSKADLIFDLYTKNNRSTVFEIISELNLNGKGFRSQVTRLTTYIRSGWNPNEDTLWLSDYKGNINGCS